MHRVAPHTRASSRVRLAALGVVIGPAVLLVHPSVAAPRPTSDYAAPYSSASTSLIRTCSTGALCTAGATAEARTGGTTATADYGRDEATTGQERVEGGGAFRQAVQLPKGSTAATVTATWHVTSAAASAVSKRGFLHAGSLLLARVQCGEGCVAEPVVTQVTLTCSEEGVVSCTSAPGADGSRARDVTLVLTATVRNLAKPSFTFWTKALAFVDAQPVCAASTTPTNPVPVTRDCSTVLDPVHSGSGHSDLDATLVGFHVDPA